SFVSDRVCQHQRREPTMQTGMCSKSSGPLAFLRATLGYGLLALAALAAAVALPTGAEAANTCNGNLEINYDTPPTPNNPNIGDPIRVELTIGAGQIQGGTKMNVTALRFDMACLAAGNLATCATTQADPGAGAGGPPINYSGDTGV